MSDRAPWRAGNPAFDAAVRVACKVDLLGSDEHFLDRLGEVIHAAVDAEAERLRGVIERDRNTVANVRVRLWAELGHRRREVERTGGPPTARWVLGLLDTLQEHAEPLRPIARDLTDCLPSVEARERALAAVAEHAGAWRMGALALLEEVARDHSFDVGAPEEREDVLDCFVAFAAEWVRRASAPPAVDAGEVDELDSHDPVKLLSAALGQLHITRTYAGSLARWYKQPDVDLSAQAERCRAAGLATHRLIVRAADLLRGEAAGRGDAAVRPGGVRSHGGR
jgi:hypothetical protein